MGSTISNKTMMNNYLLSVENLKKLGLIHQNTDTKILSVAIRRSQDINVQPALGSPLYRALLQRVATNTWNPNYLTLMNDYVVPCLVAYVDYRCALLLNEKLTNKSVGRVGDENIQANNTPDTYVFRDQLLKDAQFYKERLIGYLMDDNGDHFPEYIDCCGSPNGSPALCHTNVTKDKTGYSPLQWIV
jgi:hypothetical protein